MGWSLPDNVTGAEIDALSAETPECPTCLEPMEFDGWGEQWVCEKRTACCFGHVDDNGHCDDCGEPVDGEE